MIYTDCQESGRIKLLRRFRKREFVVRAIYLSEWIHSARMFLSHINDDQRASSREEAFYKQLFVSIFPPPTNACSLGS